MLLSVTRKTALLLHQCMCFMMSPSSGVPTVPQEPPAQSRHLQNLQADLSHPLPCAPSHGQCPSTRLNGVPTPLSRAPQFSLTPQSPLLARTLARRVNTVRHKNSQQMKHWGQLGMLPLWPWAHAWVPRVSASSCHTKGLNKKTY